MKSEKKNAVVFAYSSVGYECMNILLKRDDINITLVYTYEMRR